MKDCGELCLTLFAFAVLVSPVAALGPAYAPLCAHALVWALTGQPIDHAWC